MRIFTSVWWTTTIVAFSMLSSHKTMARALNHSCLPYSSKQDVHLIILVHGYMGNPQEMGYLKQTLERQAPSSSNVVVHSAICNLDRTHDGIEPGGARLAEEVNQMIDSFRVQNKSVSLSFVGNSLGGLYARYALSQIRYLATMDDKEGTCSTSGQDNETQLDQQSFPVRPAVFCTTATPHLGVSQHTYVPLFRAAEFVVANVLRPTGRDLFRYSSSIQELATHPKFLQPLLKFEQRIAHANAHQTDFQVPTATAAFVTPDSQSVHEVVPMPSNLQKNQFWKLSVDTRSSYQESSNQLSESREINSTELAERLDSLGWRKVFWDVRSTMPSIPLPFFGGKGNAVDQNSNKSTYTSSDLYKQFTTTDRLLFPMGHTMMVANSKNAWYARVNAGGQPVMDWVAKDMLRHILSEE